MELLKLQTAQTKVLANMRKAFQALGDISTHKRSRTHAQLDGSWGEGLNPTFLYSSPSLQDHMPSEAANFWGRLRA
eukprot:4771890-Amphidinium_carterae.1